ncbi:MAG: hypothetical protein A3J06_02310 [Candidatus Moranbacteria bacterium RIFCSPLOWO2_02_FULL_48_19]|nr:MAG: hypothetical protein A3J06_02310 [Candidatus Moranbacteria bacterium RIFCSPLOWO2_02_FULL_48_19]
MAKFHSRKIPKAEKDRMVFKFCKAVASLKTEQEAAEFIRDLLSAPEIEMLAVRLKIAELLDAGKKYGEIKKELNVSPGTIARVKEWLSISGQGYRIALIRTKEKEGERRNGNSGFLSEGWEHNVKRRYPMYYWPELLLKEIMESANQREKKKMQKVLETIEASRIKFPLYSQLKKIIQK